MFNVSSELLPLFLSFVFLSLVVLWVAISNRKNFLVLFVIIPLTLVANTVAYFTIDRLLGFPIIAQIDDKSLYLYHIESFDGEFIHVWVIEPNTTEPRAISIPNTENNRRQMEQAQERQQQGIGQQIDVDEGISVETDSRSVGGEYQVYDFVPSDTMIK